VKDNSIEVISMDMQPLKTLFKSLNMPGPVKAAMSQAMALNWSKLGHVPAGHDFDEYFVLVGEDSTGARIEVMVTIGNGFAISPELRAMLGGV
jgi:hypothetical protein